MVVVSRAAEIGHGESIQATRTEGPLVNVIVFPRELRRYLVIDHLGVFSLALSLFIIVLLPVYEHVHDGIKT